jgi:pimeloyl-ACP methyl ester carboxylesterase
LSAEPAPFTVGAAPSLAGDADGEGPPVVLLHGLTATRRYVVHGSRVLSRRGLRAVSYDARGHGESEPAPAGDGYSYDELAADLATVVAAQAGGRRCLLAGHSMGAHTIANLALAQPELVAGMVLVGPATLGAPLDPGSLAYWDALADGLSRGGVEGFVGAYDENLDPEWRETLLRIARDRLARHRHPEAVAEALRQVPRSTPFADVAELELLDVPALVVASHDEADPGHPYAVAEEWAARLPRATLVSEDPGQSPLAWQGGRLSREIADFAERPEVARLLSA